MRSRDVSRPARRARTPARRGSGTCLRLVAAAMVLGAAFLAQAAGARSLENTINPECRAQWLSASAVERSLREDREYVGLYHPFVRYRSITEVAWVGYATCTRRLLQEFPRPTGLFKALIQESAGYLDTSGPGSGESCSRYKRQALEEIERWQQQLADKRSMVEMVSSARLRDWGYLWHSSDLSIPEHWDLATLTADVERSNASLRDGQLQSIDRVMRMSESHKSNVSALSCDEVTASKDQGPWRYLKGHDCCPACPGETTTEGGAIPAFSRCSESFKGKTAICWEVGKNKWNPSAAFCVYKDILASECLKDASVKDPQIGSVYECDPS